MNSKKSKRWISVILCGILLLSVLAGCGTTPANNTANETNTNNVAPVEPVKIRLASTVASTMPSGAAAEYFAKIIEERSNGRYVVEYYPNATLGATDDLLTQVVNGTLEMAQVSNSSFGSYTSLLECFSLPFLIDSYEKEVAAIESKELSEIYKAVEEKVGVKMLTIMEHGMQFVGNNIRAVNVPADMKGLKLRTNNSDVMYKAIQALNGSPVNYAYKQIYTGLQSGAIDGEVVNITTMYAEKHYEQIKYFSKLALWPFPCTLIMSQNFWNSLSAEDQAMFTKASSDALNYNISLINDFTDRSLKAMSEANVQINEIPDMTPFKDATSSIIDEEAAKDPMVKNFIEMVKGLK